ncbi:hypothetical protein Vretifemale_482 [Volvox reticuliferus]|uniref:Uncharacterized protein n=1 Tax=Volvox reticuliferus TaxID=1737510 RepID=A0A8J4C1C8_9CHLO|nr:hypothetical protein Vretifemale_482 [Volvox reticuliferus]
MKHFEELLRSFWQLLDSTGNCWTLLCGANVCFPMRYFEGLFNEENAYRDSDAEAILSFINGQPRNDGNGWEASMGQRVQRVEAAAQLNEPFSVGEVALTIRCLSNNKACGPDRIPAECYKGAKKEIEGRSVNNLLVPHILRLLEYIRSTGDYPEQFQTSCVTPLFKKGDPRDKVNYRGLAVGSALAKCYAFILEQRLSRWVKLPRPAPPIKGGLEPILVLSIICLSYVM